MIINYEIPAAVPTPGRTRFLAAAAELLRRWKSRRSTRRALASLDELQLADIGLTPDEASREIVKPFWSK